MPTPVSKLLALATQAASQRFILLGLLLALGGWLVWIQEATLTRPATSIPQTHGEPDASIQGALLKRYNAQGQLFQILEAEQATHYPEADLTELKLPIINHWTPAGQLWVLSAKLGELQGQEDIFLQDEVRLQPKNPDSAYTPELFTQRLWLNTEQSSAHTPDPVSLVSPAGRTHAVGLEASLNSHQIQLLSQVDSLYTSRPRLTEQEQP